MDAMSGRGELGDQGLVADLYGLGGLGEYRTGWTGADWGGLADGGGRGGLGGEGRTGQIGQGTDEAD